MSIIFYIGMLRWRRNKVNEDFEFVAIHKTSLSYFFSSLFNIQCLSGYIIFYHHLFVLSY